MKPLVSIIVPVYNAEQFVGVAIQSVLDQTYLNLELIIINDGSTDQSLSVIRSFSDSRIFIIDRKNKGGGAARNAGIEKARGEFIKFLDADDVLLPDALEKQVFQSIGLEGNEVVFGDFNFINKTGVITQSNKFSDQETLLKEPESFFLKNWKILISCPLHKREILERIGGFDEKLPNGQESDLHFRLAIEGIRFIYRPGSVFNYRSHNEKDRVSVKRIKGVREFWVMVYKLNKKIELLLLHNDCLSPNQKKYFSSSYFGLARKSFISGKKVEGHYFLSNAQKYSRYRIPLLKKSRIWGFLYLLSGFLLGYVNVEKALSKIAGKPRNNTRELDILFD